MTHPRAGSKEGFGARALRFAPHRSDWSRTTIGRDLSAGLMVALVALPLALGFGVASGVGAAAGITPSTTPSMPSPTAGCTSRAFSMKNPMTHQSLPGVTSTISSAVEAIADRLQ